MAAIHGYEVTVQIASAGGKAAVRIPARGTADEEALARAVRSYAQALADLRRNAKPRTPDLRPWWTR